MVIPGGRAEHKNLRWRGKPLQFPHHAHAAHIRQGVVHYDQVRPHFPGKLHPFPAALRFGHEPVSRGLIDHVFQPITKRGLGIDDQHSLLALHIVSTSLMIARLFRHSVAPPAVLAASRQRIQTMPTTSAITVPYPRIQESPINPARYGIDHISAISPYGYITLYIWIFVFLWVISPKHPSC